MGRITPIPRPFGPCVYPEGGEFSGIIVKEFGEDYEAGDYVYRYLVQFMNSEGDELVRVAYYRKPKGGNDESWIFGGQYSPIMPKKIYQNLVRKSLTT